MYTFPRSLVTSICQDQIIFSPLRFLVDSEYCAFLVTGLFLEPDYATVEGQAGLFKTGQWYMLGVQALACLLTSVWTIVLTYLFLKVYTYYILHTKMIRY